MQSGIMVKFLRNMTLAPLVLAFAFLQLGVTAIATGASVPQKSVSVVNSLNQSRWEELEAGLRVIRAVTPEGLTISAFQISGDTYQFSVKLQGDDSGSRAREIGEREGAVLVVNGGFFASTSEGALYPVGYLRLNDEVLSKGWTTAGGVISFKPDSIDLSPTHAGIPQDGHDAMQTKPMIIEPGGKWAMGSNLGEVKRRTLLCRLKNGETLLVVVTRQGLSLYEAGWVLRGKAVGGFFGCDSAVALDGGRSTQIWLSGHEQYSYAGLTPVHSFLVVSKRED